MPHYFKFENKKSGWNGDNVFTNEKDFQSKLKSIQQKRPEDFNLILEIKKLFEPSARQFILRHLISLYDIDLGGFKYNLPEKQVILLKPLLNTLNKQVDIIKQNKKNDFGEINWDEFWSVVKGNGPCNKQRLQARNKAHDERAWVREAARVYAEKKVDSKKDIAA